MMTMTVESFYALELRSPLLYRPAVCFAAKLAQSGRALKLRDATLSYSGQVPDMKN